MDDHTGLVLVGDDLSGRPLSGTTWTDCRFERVDFSGADLAGAAFVGGTLSGCRFDRANLANVTFDDVKRMGNEWSGARGLESAFVDEAPALLVPPEAEALGALPEHMPLLGWAARLATLGAFVDVREGRPLGQTGVEDLEGALGVALPPDHRRFLIEVGGAQIGSVTAFDSSLLSALHRDLRRCIEDFQFPDPPPPDWLDRPCPVAGFPPEAPRTDALGLARRRLGVGARHLPSLQADRRDAMRFAWRHLVPVLDDGRHDLHHLALCAGPRGQYYRVCAKGWEVDLVGPSFLEVLVTTVAEEVAAR